MKRKLLAIALVGAMTLSLAACGGSGSSGAATDDSTAGAAASSGGGRDFPHFSEIDCNLSPLSAS